MTMMRRVLQRHMVDVVRHRLLSSSGGRHQRRASCCVWTSAEETEAAGREAKGGRGGGKEEGAGERESARARLDGASRFGLIAYDVVSFLSCHGWMRSLRPYLASPANVPFFTSPGPPNIRSPRF
jgi:hypothetical protein